MQRHLLISRLAFAISVIALCFVWARQISGSLIIQDAAHSLRMAVNLVHHGTMSMDTSPPYDPSMYREPLPVFLDAVAVKVVDAIRGADDHDAYFAGDRARLLKYQDLVWMLILSLTVFAATRALTSSSMLAFACMLLVSVRLPLASSGLDGLGMGTLRSEILTAALLVVGSTLVSTGWMRAKPMRLSLAGLAFGLLTLVKASFLHVFVGMVAILCVTGAAQWKRTGDWRAATRELLLVACFAVVVLPWMYRNYLHFDTFSIAQRGGSVLAIRVTKDQMTAEEYVGSFYVWAPHRLRPLVGWVLGFSPDDLMRGGRLQHLNRTAYSDFYEDDNRWERAGRPDLVISYYRKSRAEHVRLRKELEANGEEDMLDSDAILLERSLQYIREHPWRHLAMTIPFLWRGALIAFPVLFVTLLYAVWRRRWELGLFALPAFGLVMFYALFSHFIPRYGVPVYPVVIVCAAALLRLFFDRGAQPAVQSLTQPAAG